MTTEQPTDAEARALIRGSLDESLLVEAAAGTGKTTELIQRLVAVLRSGRTTVDRIVAVTFTKKAAGELKLRLREELDRARGGVLSPAEAEALEAALARLEEARIGTIHGFCADLLRERPVEAGVDPSFEELTEAELSRMFEPLFRRWFEEQLSDLPPGLSRALARHQSAQDGSPLERLIDAARRLVEWRDFPAAWRREPFDRAAVVERLLAQLEEVAAMSRRCPNRRDALRRSLEKAADLADIVTRQREAQALPDLDLLEAALIKLLADLERDRKDGSGKFSVELSREAMLTARDALLGALAAFKEEADADLAALLHAELAEVVQRYQLLKRSSGRLDFNDLLLTARRLLVESTEVRAQLAERFSHLFVDEFQDTDPLQAEILLLLCADDPTVRRWQEVRPVKGKLFLVGDPKQSIYRFRRADMALYQKVKAQLAGAGVRILHLGKSFRAVRPLQELVNLAFAPLMQPDQALQGVQAEYVALEAHTPATEGQPAVVVLPVPDPYGRERVAKTKIEESLPQAVGAFIEWLIKHSGWRVRDRDSAAMVPIHPGHVLILFRRFVSFHTDLTRRYTQALEARGIPHVLVGARSFHRREEVETLRAALTAVEWPDDELSVYATLRGSLWAFADATLLRFKQQLGHLDPLRSIRSIHGPLELELASVADALSFLGRLHRKRNRQAIVHTVNALLGETRAHAGFALRPGGNQILANLEKVCDLARGFELSGGGSFRAFVLELDKQAEDERSNDAPVLEEGAEGVRIMTVHTAKGLEAPVVILADIGAPLAHQRPDRHLDPERQLAATRLLGCAPWELIDHQQEEQLRDRAEGVRLAYVASTRARDLLVVPAVGEGPLSDSWITPLDRVIFPPRSEWRRGTPAEACPSFGDASVVAQPPEGGPEATVRPGLHRAGPGAPGVVWWDPNVLQLEAPSAFGLRQAELLAEPPAESPEAGGGAQESAAAFAVARAAALASGARPSIRILSPSLAAHDPPGAPRSIELERVDASGQASELRGKRFGALVHAILRDVALGASSDELGRLAALQARLLGAPKEELLAAVERVSAALVHPRLVRARAASELVREAPINLALEDGTLLEGTIDLAYREPDGAWLVIDFKTDRELDASSVGPRRQLAWYLHALEQLSGSPARGVLLLL